MRARIILPIELVLMFVLLGGLAASVASPPEQAELIDHDRLLLSGAGLDSDRAAALAATLRTNPGDIEARLQLIGHAFHSRAADPLVRADHVAWFVANRPELPVLARPPFRFHPKSHGAEAYARIERLWLAQVDSHPDRAAILGNAAAFFSLTDPERAIDLLRRARSAEPEEPRWSEMLADVLSRRAGDEDAAAEARRDAAREKLRELEAAVETGARPRYALLARMAKQAYEADELVKAEAYAQECLRWAESDRENWNFGNAVHDGHMVLGRLALRAGDVARAKERLLAAGATRGSPQLNTFGPNMALARDLLEAGEPAAVLEYFELCRKFWEFGQDDLAGWTAHVQAGAIPNFGANLVF